MSRSSARKADGAAPSSEKTDASLISGNVKIHDRRTSVRLEPEMWSALYEVASMESLSIHEVCSVVDDNKLEGESFSSALRVFLLKYYREVARGTLKHINLKKKAPEGTKGSSLSAAERRAQ